VSKSKQKGTLASNLRKMPSKSQICTYWFPHLLTIGKVSDEEDWCKVCFACSISSASIFGTSENTIALHRAHIHPKVLGGTDEVDNLHLLCQYCHLASEFIYGTDYWAWFMQRKLMHTLQIYSIQANCILSFNE